MRPGPSFWVAAVLGWAIVAYGVRGIFADALDTRPAQLARFVVGGAIAHDVVLAPLVVIVSVAVARAVPDRARAVVQAALIVTAVVSLFAFPLVRGYGRAAGNPSSLPHDYAANLAIVLSAVWGMAILTLVISRKLRSSSARVAP